MVAERLAIPLRFADNAPTHDRFAENGTSIQRLHASVLVPHIVEARPREAEIEAVRLHVPAIVAVSAVRRPRAEVNDPLHPIDADIAQPRVKEPDNPPLHHIEVVDAISHPVFGGSIHEYGASVAVGKAEYLRLSKYHSCVYRLYTLSHGAIVPEKASHPLERLGFLFRTE